MVSALAYVFLIGLPAAGTLAAVISIVLAQRRAVNETASSSTAPLANTRLLVFFILPSTLLMFSLALVSLYSSRWAEGLPSTICDYGAMAYGIPALMAGISIGLICQRGIGMVLRNPQLFGRYLSLAVLPIAVAIFGMVISVQILGRAMDWPSGVDSFAEPAMRAAVFVSIGSLGGLLTARLSSSVEDIGTLNGYRRAMRRSHIGDAVSLPLLLLAFLSIM